jgi:creatinine amidohydrolase
LPHLPSRYWQDLPWPAFRELPPNTVAVLPVASIEQHGPHLPVSVDTTINGGVIARTLAVTPPDLPVLVLPTQSVALSVEHLRFPGTLTTSAETLIALVTHIGASVARTGVKRLVIVNSHGGNVAALDIAARRIRIESDILAVNAMWARMGKPEALREPVESTYGIHAGRDETSVMLALTPHLVHMDRRWTSPAAGRAPPIARPRYTRRAARRSPGRRRTCTRPARSATPPPRRPRSATSSWTFAAERMSALWQQVAAFDVEAGWRTSRTRMADIPALAAALDGIETCPDRALLRLKSRDFYWYSPILKAQLDGKAADLHRPPRDEAEVLRILAPAARSACPSRCAAAAPAITGSACRSKAAWCST